MSQFSFKLLREHSIYPGHPITLAYLIVSKYDSFEAAIKISKFGSPAALEDCDIDGAGGEVYSALNLLKKIVDGVSLDSTLNQVEWKPYGYEKRIQAGNEQAIRILNDFKVKVQHWIKPT